MPDELVFDTDFAVKPGESVRLSPLVRRVVANNPGPFTFKGTCSYIVGEDRVAVIDPGPDSAEHVENLLAAVRGETVTHILVSHTHRDHSPAAKALKAATGALIVGCSAHPRAKVMEGSGANRLEASIDYDYAPDIALAEGDTVEGEGFCLRAVETPGHLANHLCFSLLAESALFSADHVMAWSTTVIAPPDGSMSAYMASLDKLRGRDETVYWPGHGGPVRDPQRFVRALVHHRRQREASIVTRLAEGDRTIPDIVRAIYQGLNPALLNPAGLSVFAHLQDLVARGIVATDGPPSLTGEYRLA